MCCCMSSKPGCCFLLAWQRSKKGQIVNRDTNVSHKMNMPYLTIDCASQMLYVCCERTFIIFIDLRYSTKFYLALQWAWGCITLWLSSRSSSISLSLSERCVHTDSPTTSQRGLGIQTYFLNFPLFLFKYTYMSSSHSWTEFFSDPSSLERGSFTSDCITSFIPVRLSKGESLSGRSAPVLWACASALPSHHPFVTEQRWTGLFVEVSEWWNHLFLDWSCPD